MKKLITIILTILTITTYSQVSHIGLSRWEIKKLYKNSDLTNWEEGTNKNSNKYMLIQDSYRVAVYWLIKDTAYSINLNYEYDMLNTIIKELNKDYVAINNGWKHYTSFGALLITLYRYEKYFTVVIEIDGI